MKIRAIKKFGRFMPGDVLDVESYIARQFICTKYAEEYKEEPRRRQRRTYKRRDMVADAPE